MEYFASMRSYRNDRAESGVRHIAAFADIDAPARGMRR